MRGINDEQVRYDQVHLVQDLFGDWTLSAVWGALGSHRGGLCRTGVASHAGSVGIAAWTGRWRTRRARAAVATGGDPRS